MDGQLIPEVIKGQVQGFMQADFANNAIRRINRLDLLEVHGEEAKGGGLGRMETSPSNAKLVLHTLRVRGVIAEVDGEGAIGAIFHVVASQES